MSAETADLQMPARPLPPAPDVPRAELDARLENIRREMAQGEIDHLVLTDRKNIEYFTDYRTLSWQYHARPVFLIVTPEDSCLIGSLVEAKNVDQKDRPFAARYYDGYLDEAVAAIAAHISQHGSRIALDYGPDMYGRGSLALIDRLREIAAPAPVVPGVDHLGALVRHPLRGHRARGSPPRRLRRCASARRQCDKYSMAGAHDQNAA